MKDWKTLLKILVSFGLVVWLIERVDWPTVGHILGGVYLPFIGVYIVLQITGNIISAAKWRYLAGLQGSAAFSLKDGFFAYLTGAFINNFLPSTVGGDTYRVYWMSQVDERSRAFAVVFFDRVTGLLALFLMAGAGLAVLPLGTLFERPLFIIFSAVTLSVAIAMFLALIWTERFYTLAESLALLLPWPKPAIILRDFRSFAQSQVYGRAILWALLFTVVGIGGSNFFLFSSLGAELSMTAFGSAIFAATLVANLPISINNIGVKEWAYVFFFGLVGVSAELAVTAALLSRLLQMGISFIALPHYITERKQNRSAASGNYSSV